MEKTDLKKLRFNYIGIMKYTYLSVYILTYYRNKRKASNLIKYFTRPGYKLAWQYICGQERENRALLKRKQSRRRTMHGVFKDLKEV